MDTKEKIMIDGAEYDPSLTQFLIDNGYDRKNIVPLVPFDGSWADNGPTSELESMMSKINKRKQSGCIFTLPAKGFYPNHPERADWVVVVYAPISSDEIRRRVAIKAFL